MPSNKRVPIKERFWDKVNKNGPIPRHRPDLGPCWLWTAAKRKEGYGRIGQSGEGSSHVYAHIASYKMAKGEIPEGLELDHLCRNPSCVNPDHLEAVTGRENILRGTGPSAINSRKTHCNNGHEFTENNTYRWYKKPNVRFCRKCRSIIEKKRTERDTQARQSLNRSITGKGNKAIG